MRTRSLTVLCAALAVAASCRLPVTSRQPVFIEGRAVAAAGDTLLAVALPDSGGVARLGRGGGIRDVFGAGVLHSPVEVQFVAGRWHVSDVIDGNPAIRIFDAAGTLERTLDLAGRTPLAHQFAVLTDGRIVIEAPDGRLVAIAGDSTATFAATETGPRPSLLLAAEDGVVHAVPDRTITLYNRFGRIRWRVEWPWVETAHVSDLAVDARGRIHVLSGVADADAFIVYTMEFTSGEVVRWSKPEPRPTFVVERLGDVLMDASGRWEIGEW